VDIDNLDSTSLRYISNVSGNTIPATYAALKMFLATTTPLKLSYDESLPLTDCEFDSFISEMCVESTDCCHSFLNAFQLFGTQPTHCHDYSGEMEVVPLVDAALLPLQVLLKTTTARNSKTVTTGNKLPDFKMTVGSAKVPIMLGEEKSFTGYQQGSQTKDPVVDLQKKAPWDSWDQFYGSIPYYFAYTCVGDPRGVILTVGVMDRASQKFQPLFSNNILSPAERPEFSSSLMKLFPVVKSVGDHCIQMASQPWKIEKTMVDGTSRSMSIVIISNTTTFRKEWQFRNAPQQAAEFALRMSNVFRLLSTRAFPERLTFMTLFDAVSCPVGSFTVKAHFIPFGKRVLILDEMELLRAIRDIVLALQYLHHIGIVHNDIRWDNIMKSEVSYFLVDFDDAYILSEESPMCPALDHLSTAEHSPKSFMPHGGEVDCWAVGRLILTQFQTLSGRMRELGRNIQSSDSIGDVVNLVMEFSP
jgi:hypothetical protein